MLNIRPLSYRIIDDLHSQTSASLSTIRGAAHGHLCTVWRAREGGRTSSKQASTIEISFWFVFIGLLLVVMALSTSTLKRLPLTTAILYMAVGVMLGPAAFGAIQLDPLKDSVLLERLTEVIVIISLFSVGLKLRLPFSAAEWRPPLKLAFLSMTATVCLVALVGIFGLNLPVGAAVLLGAILAPTDPVLASHVQTEHPWDQDLLRFSLTGEAGMYDGTAFPFVMLGLGLVGLYEIGSFGWRWLGVDVLWAITGGLCTEGVLGTLVG